MPPKSNKYCKVLKINNIINIRHIKKRVEKIIKLSLNRFICIKIHFYFTILIQYLILIIIFDFYYTIIFYFILKS